MKPKSDCIYHYSIDNQTVVCLALNQSGNGKFNLISVWFNKISKRFLCVYEQLMPLGIMASQLRARLKSLGIILPCCLRDFRMASPTGDPIMPRGASLSRCFCFLKLQTEIILKALITFLFHWISTSGFRSCFHISLEQIAYKRICDILLHYKVMTFNNLYIVAKLYYFLNISHNIWCE